MGNQTTRVQEPTPPEAEQGQTAPAAGRGPDPNKLAALQAMLTQLLELQCSLIAGAAGVTFLAAGATQGRMGGIAAKVIASNASQIAPGAELLEPAVLARMEKVAMAACANPQAGAADSLGVQRGRAMYGDELRLRALAVPLLADGRVEGASVILVRERAGWVDEPALAALAASNARFEAFLWRQQCMVETEQKLMLREAIELLDAAQQGSSAPAMSAIMAQELKRRFACTRVSIGLIQGDFLRLVAVSSSEEIDHNAPAAMVIEAAMEECASQDSEVVYPPPAEAELEPGLRRVTRAHEQLSRTFGPAAILSLPLRVDGDLVGVALLERGAGDPFPFAATSLLRLVAETIGPALWTRRLADRGIWAVTKDRAGLLAREFLGARHTGAKLLGGLVLAALLAAAVIPVPSRVSAPAEVKAAAARTISPPYSGYLAAVYVKPGETVKMGQALAEMDAADLQLQMAQVQGELTSNQTQADEARNRSDMAKVAQFDAEVRKSQATIDLLSDNISRATIRSPVDGIVGRGDLEQFVRAKVEPSQPLFEVVTAANVTIAYVDERDIQRVKTDQGGRFVSKALPGEKLPVKVARITPVAEAHEGVNAYQVELELQGMGNAALLASMRPGMTGTVKLDDGWTTSLASIMRPLIDEARMKLWW